MKLFAIEIRKFRRRKQLLVNLQKEHLPTIDQLNKRRMYRKRQDNVSDAGTFEGIHFLYFIIFVYNFQQNKTIILIFQ